jgi:excisionase family DNA binding protein
MKKMLSTAEVAEMFNVSKATMYRLIEGRKITFYKIGGALRFTEDDVNRFLEESRVNPIK